MWYYSFIRRVFRKVLCLIGPKLEQMTKHYFIFIFLQRFLGWAEIFSASSSHYLPMIACYCCHLKCTLPMHTIDVRNFLVWLLSVVKWLLMVMCSVFDLQKQYQIISSLFAFHINWTFGSWMVVKKNLRSNLRNCQQVWKS